MNKHHNAQTTQSRVYALYVRLAGEKLAKVQATADQLRDQGYKLERAWADALAQHKCPNFIPDSH